MTLMTSGLDRLLRGLRTGDPKIVAFGAGLVGLSLIRRPRKRKLLVAHKLEPGAEYRVKIAPRPEKKRSR